MTAGYQALHDAAAWFDLTGRGEIFAAGEDRARLLHGISTNHIEGLRPGEGCYAFFLNAQGRIQADANIFCLPDRLLVDTEPETRESLYRHIDRYIIAEDVTLEDAAERLAVIAIEGPQSAAAMAGLGAPAPEGAYAHAAWETYGAIVAHVSATGGPGFRIFLPGERKGELVSRLHGIPPATAEDQRTVRVEHGRPRYGDDISATTLPQETQQMHAVSFHKGCYLGQEIVERIRAQGQVHRQLERLEYEPGHAPDAQITSEVWSPGAGKMVALGYVRR